MPQPEEFFEEEEILEDEETINEEEVDEFDIFDASCHAMAQPGNRPR